MNSPNPELEPNAITADHPFPGSIGEIHQLMTPLG